MKKFFTFLIILSATISIAQEAEDLKPEFKFKTETINYGKIISGADGVRVFEFTNVGKSPLIISRVQASCGCTVPKKPNYPIMPGEEGKIEVAYDTKRLGGFSKAITIFSNAKNERKMVKIKGYSEKTVSFEKKKNLLSVDN